MVTQLFLSSEIEDFQYLNWNLDEIVLYTVASPITNDKKRQFQIFIDFEELQSKIQLQTDFPHVPCHIRYITN